MRQPVFDELRPLLPQIPFLRRFPVETRVTVHYSELFSMGYAHGYRTAPLMFVSTEYIRGWVSGYLDYKWDEAALHAEVHFEA